jgi:hypothetical protein
LIQEAGILVGGKGASDAYGARESSASWPAGQRSRSQREEAGAAEPVERGMRLPSRLVEGSRWPLPVAAVYADPPGRDVKHRQVCRQRQPPPSLSWALSKRSTARRVWRRVQRRWRAATSRGAGLSHDPPATGGAAPTCGRSGVLDTVGSEACRGDSRNQHQREQGACRWPGNRRRREAARPTAPKLLITAVIDA